MTTRQPKRRARERSAYRNETHSTGGAGNLGPKGFQVLNGVEPTDLIMPKLEDRAHRLVFRPWPALDYQQPDLIVPGRQSEKAHGQSDWIIRVRMANYIGTHQEHKASFILYRPENEARDHGSTPYEVLFWAAWNAIKKSKFHGGDEGHQLWDNRWNVFTTFEKKGGERLPKPGHKWFVVGSVYINGKKDWCDEKREVPYGEGPNDPLPVLMLGQQIGGNLMEFLDARKDGEDQTDPMAAFKFGDPTGIWDAEADVLRGGLIVTCFDALKFDSLEDLAESKKIPKNHSWNPENKTEMSVDYQVAVARTYVDKKGRSYGSDFGPEMCERVRDKRPFWWDNEQFPDDPYEKGILRVPSIEEQCFLIAKAFSDVPKLLKYGWMENSEFFTPEVREILVAKRAAAVPDDLQPEPAKRTAKPKPAAAAKRRDPSVAPPVDDDFGPEAEPEQEPDGPVGFDEFDQAAGDLEPPEEADDEGFPGDDEGDGDDEFDDSSRATAKRAARGAEDEPPDEAPDEDFDDAPPPRTEQRQTTRPSRVEPEPEPEEDLDDAVTDDVDDDVPNDDDEEPPPDDEFDDSQLGGDPFDPDAEADRIRGNMEKTLERAGGRSSTAATRPQPPAKPATKPAATKPAAAAAKPAAAAAKPPAKPAATKGAAAKPAAAKPTTRAPAAEPPASGKRKPR